MDCFDNGAKMSLDFDPKPLSVSGIVQLALPEFVFEETDMGAACPLKLPVALLLRGVEGKRNAGWQKVGNETEAGEKGERS